jgi:hypothetical protein
MRRSREHDRQLVQEMWTVANNEPLSLVGLQPYGMIDRERYRRLVDNLTLELTLETDPQTGAWSYEFALIHPEGERIDEDIVAYWLDQFFGKEARHAAKRGFLLTTDARFTFPYNRR